MPAQPARILLVACQLSLLVARLLSTLAVVDAAQASAQSGLGGESIRIARATGRITIDGDLSDEGWRGATRVDKWYEVNPGDSTEPKVRNVGYLAYDDRFLKTPSVPDAIQTIGSDGTSDKGLGKFLIFLSIGIIRSNAPGGFVN